MQPIFETSVSKIMEIFHASKTFAIYLTDSYQFLMFKGLDFILRFLAMAESEQAPFCSFGLTKTFNFMLFYANSLFIPPPYTIPLPLTGERDVSFRRYGVRCFISVI